jgi:hypothetical protein
MLVLTIWPATSCLVASKLDRTIMSHTLFDQYHEELCIHLVASALTHVCTKESARCHTAHTDLLPS